MIDFHTFGRTKAGETLVIFLNEKYPKLTSKVSVYYHKYARDMRSMRNAANCFQNGGLLELMDLHKQKKFEAVKNSSLPTELKSYLLNVMQVLYAENLKEIKGLLYDNRS